jgi:mannose-1-phosphate guanylyltransferase
MLKLAHCIMNREANYANLAGSAPLEKVALLLAGGDGTRLQELTREIAGAPIPKQYCRLLHGSSLLEATLSRTELFAKRDRISVVVNENHLGLAREQLRVLPESNILVQPLNRDTGPGMLFALMHLAKTHPNSIVAVFPTDHYIDDDRAFIAHVLRAVNTVSHMQDKVAMLGIAPDRPETGYGYIVPSNPLGSSERAFHVKAFTEKPNIHKARDIISRGGVWNTFVMVFKLSRMLELLAELVPDQYESFSELLVWPERASKIYENLEPWNLSAQVLSRIPQHLVMLEVADVGWSDWGTRESVERTYKALNLVPFWNMSVTDPIPG